MRTVLLGCLVLCLYSASADSKQIGQAFSCPGDGFFPHSTDCSAYFRCQDGVATFKQCTAPLHFNKRIEGCDWPLSDTCEPDEYDYLPEYASPPQEIGIPEDIYCPLQCICTIAHPCNCSYYFRCSFGKPLLRMCPNRLFYNPLTEQCDIPSNVKCVIEPSCFPTTPTPTPSPTTPPTPSPTTPPTPSPTTPPQEPECCNNFIHDPWNCSVYYVTVNGKKERKVCPGRLHFNRGTKVCDHPRSAGCIKPVDQCSCHCCRVQDECDCTKYFYCENGALTHEQCREGLVFNENTLNCDYPGSTNRVCKGTPNFETTSPGPFTTPVTPTTPGPICGCGDCVLHNPSDCSSFFKCIKGKIHSVPCPPGYRFDRKNKRCAPKDSVTCPLVGDPELCPREQGLFPLPGKCTDFIECDRGVAFIQKCPINTEFNPNTLQCDWPTKSCGGYTSTDTRCPKATGLFRHPDHCGKFIHCENGIVFEKSCAGSLYFNANLQVCDWPENVDCSGNMPMYSNSQDHSELECKETPGIQCPCACRIPNYDSCDGYYQCTSEGKACAKTCPTGLKFNRVTRVCDIPQNVKCSLDVEEFEH